MSCTLRAGLGLTLLSPQLLIAADVSPVATPSVFGGLFQVFLALVIVLAAIAGAAWLLRRYGPTQIGQGNVMRVLGGAMIGPRERLVLVEVGETWLVVGVAPGHVSAVHSMPKPAQADQLREMMLNQQPGFNEWLKSAWKKRGGV